MAVTITASNTPKTYGGSTTQFGQPYQYPQVGSTPFGPKQTSKTTATTTSTFEPTQPRPELAPYIEPGLPAPPTLPTYGKPGLTPIAPLVMPELAPVDPFAAPELAAMDPFAAPEYDERRVSALTQKSAAPYLYQARLGLREAVGVAGRGEYNPNVTARNLKSALQGYGVAVGGIVETAGRVGREQYAQEYGIEAEEAKINYAQAIADRNITFGAKAEEAKMNYAQAIVDRDIMFSAKTEEARTNHAQAIADRDAIFTADLHAADANFQAAINNIKMVYGAEVATALQSAGEQNARNATIFETAMNEYLVSATKTTTVVSEVVSGKTMDYGTQQMLDQYKRLKIQLGGAVAWKKYGPLREELDVLESRLMALGVLSTTIKTERPSNLLEMAFKAL